MNSPFYTPQPPPQRPAKPVALPPLRHRAQEARPDTYCQATDKARRRTVFPITVGLILD